LVYLVVQIQGVIKIMVKEIILLTESIEVEPLTEVLHKYAPTTPVTHVVTRRNLDVVVETGLAGKLLIGFCTPVIVSKSILNALEGPAYNFHPGPPNFPGLFPACFAIYSCARRFGVTAHEMYENVDEGPVVGVEWVDIPLDIDRIHLEAKSHQLIMQLFERLVPEMVKGVPLTHTEDQWSGYVTRKKDFETICEVPCDISLAELELRYRAVGQGPSHSLNIKLHGVRFNLDTGADDGKVYNGGREVT
jgi:folate-dependent phosphoribosylglycinamide formyltransferase PurN